ncbi:phage portal protein [Mesorhizobium sp. M00.F.Ca.ET.186.01.1.1]|nr:phage portal protein [bacterium M00.F.Ca.ET.205.01.1.1]TGU53189.1 phage portal protein [bacterium M00.F.Ca.ET.152.01.1.1]TGV36166.1 phage portal protein [Mesorhizobium sp. M00.F.Ca.ET.186.01.1.1]TGZ43742.1 phage portal protein [bacterium M00.F.Ca.ET.162.01.1.1]
MAFDGATRGRRAQGWRVVSTDANAENLPALSRLRDVARDMVRNNPHAARGKSVLANNIVGTGIIPSIAGGAPKTTKARLLDLVKAHLDTTAIDNRGRTNLYGLQWMVMATVAESGEALVRRRLRRSSDGLPLPFQLEVLEPDFIDSTRDGPVPNNGGFMVQGLQFDPIGRLVGYWLYSQHPGSYSGVAYESKLVPASDVAHVFRTDRPGQARGVTWFSPVILKMRDLADYADAQLIRQKVAACFAAFIHSDENISTVMPAADPNKAIQKDTGGIYQVESLEPGLIQRLKPGEEVTFGTPPSVGEYAGYKAAELRDIAVGLGVSYEVLSGDLTGVNFSSGRMGWLEFQRTISVAQNFMMIPQFCGPVARWFLEAASIVLARDLSTISILWTPPRREMINPKEEVAGAVAEIRAGLSSRSEKQRQAGYDPGDLDAENAADNVRADDLGLIFDSDPRYRTAAGNAVTAATPGDAPHVDAGSSDTSVASAVPVSLQFPGGESIKVMVSASVAEKLSIFSGE